MSDQRDKSASHPNPELRRIKFQNNQVIPPRKPSEQSAPHKESEGRVSKRVVSASKHSAVRRTRIKPPNQLLSIKEAAAYVGVSVTTVRRWIDSDDPHTSRKLPHYRAGRQIRIDKGDLIAFLRNGGD